MALVCSRISITWHDGVWPSSAGSRVLLSETDKVEEGSLFLGGVEQAIQRADYLRGQVPRWFPRGNRTSTLQWDRGRPYDRHDNALAQALADAETMPWGEGWVEIELVDLGRVWVATPAIVRREDWRYDARSGHLLQQWSIDAGPMTEIALEAEDGSLTLEIGTEILTEDEDYYLALEDL